MPPASFKDEETRIAFYEKYNKQFRERYYSDPEFRARKLEIGKAVYNKQKELGTGRFSQANIEKKAQRRAQKRAEKKAEVVVAV